VLGAANLTRPGNPAVLLEAESRGCLIYIKVEGLGSRHRDGLSAEGIPRWCDGSNAIGRPAPRRDSVELRRALGLQQPVVAARRQLLRAPCRAVMIDLIPPRTLKSPTTSIHRGLHAAVRSSRIRLTARS